MPSETTTTRVRSVQEIAPEVREIVLEPPAALVEFQPGQWLSLHLPVGEHPPLVRAYSLAAPPSPGGELVLCLDRVPDGLGSDYLFSVGPGDEITLARALGNFVLPETDSDLLWIARYTGIVPFRAMLCHLRQHPPAGRVVLLYEAPRPEDLVYHAELVRAAEELPWFDMVATVEEPDSDWAGRTVPALDLLPELVGDCSDWVPMVCGIREFVRPVRDYFYGLGYDRKSVKWENYD